MPVVTHTTLEITVMTNFLLRAGLAASAATVALTAVHAQPPAVPAPPPKVIHWPGGWMMLDGQEMILRSATPGGTTNVIRGSGNGFGNKIVVGGGSGGGTTVISNSRNGVGNRIVLDPDDWVFDVDQWLPPVARPVPLPPPLPLPQPAVPAPPVYVGKANEFWQVKAFSEELDCNIYWSAADKLWYRYHAECDKYRPLPTQPPAPKE